MNIPVLDDERDPEGNHQISGGFTSFIEPLSLGKQDLAWVSFWIIFVFVCMLMVMTPNATGIAYPKESTWKPCFWLYPDTENRCPQVLIIGLVCLDNLQLHIPGSTPLSYLPSIYGLSGYPLYGKYHTYIHGLIVGFALICPCLEGFWVDFTWFREVCR